HLMRAIALEPLGSRVPAGHDAIRIEHVDRIVHHAVNQQPEPLLALAQDFFVALTLAQVACYFREGQELSVVVAQRGDNDIGPKTRSILADAPALILEVSF